MDKLVACEICGKRMHKITGTHLRTHAINFEHYMRLYPDTITCLWDGAIRRRQQQAELRKLKENDAFVVCQLCGGSYRQIHGRHLRYKHGITFEDYTRQFPDQVYVSPELSKALKSKIKERFEDPTFREKWSAICKKTQSNPEVQQRISQSHLKRFREDPLLNDQRSQQLYERYAKETPEQTETRRARRKARFKDPVLKAKLKISQKASWVNAEQRRNGASKRMSELYADPIRAAERIQAQKEGANNPVVSLKRKLNAAIRYSNPEAGKKLSEIHKRSYALNPGRRWRTSEALEERHAIRRDFGGDREAYERAQIKLFDSSKEVEVTEEGQKLLEEMVKVLHAKLKEKA